MYAAAFGLLSAWPASVQATRRPAARAHARTYYVSSSTGDDRNAGTRPSAPWRSVARANAALRTLRGGDRVLFKGGEVFRDDYVRCANLVKATPETTLAGTPPLCSGTAEARVVIGSYGGGAAVLDGADPLQSPGAHGLIWTRMREGIWQAAMAGPAISKLYMDHPTSESVALLPVPNYVGNHTADATYALGDEVSGSFVHGGVEPTRGTGTGTGAEAVWNHLDPAGKAQSFPATNTAMQNLSAGVPSTAGVFGIAAYPAVWYQRDNVLYVKLADGSDPNTHSFEGTRRPYGVLLESVNNVTVKDLQIEHAGKSGILAVAFSRSTSGYFTNEGNRFENNLIFNWGDTVADSLELQDGKNILEGGIVVRAGGEASASVHLLRGDSAAGNRIGMMDGYFARNNGKAGILFSGMDGGGTANSIVIEKNLVRTVNGQGIIYAIDGIPAREVKNRGGRVTGNELTNNQGNLYFTATMGGMDDHNKIHDSFGEGIQTGGGSVSTSAVPQVHAYNLIYNLGISATGGLYNGFDCNGGFDGGYWVNNTVYNTYAAAMTFEHGCSGSHVHNNIMDMNGVYWPQGGALNESNLVYFVAESHDARVDWSHNLYLLGSNKNVARSTGKSYGYDELFAGWPDRNSLGGVDPRFANPSKGDFRLLPGSPAIGAGEGGKDLGALPSRR